MKGTIVNYRGGKRTQKTNQLVVIVENIKNKEGAKKLMKKKVEWTTQTGKKIRGEVSKVHGNKGAVLVKFERGLPGQAIGTGVEVLA